MRCRFFLCHIHVLTDERITIDNDSVIVTLRHYAKVSGSSPAYEIISAYRVSEPNRRRRVWHANEGLPGLVSRTIPPIPRARNDVFTNGDFTPINP